MNNIFFIAVNTFKESVRNRVLYAILFLALGVIALSVSVADWSVFERIKVMEDFGLAAMSLTGLFMAVFIGVGLLGREISTKTAYMIIAKPVSRSAFLIGKFAGLIAVLLLNFAIMSLVFWIAIRLLGGRPTPQLGAGVLLIWVELAVLVAAAVLFSTFTSPMLASMFTLAFYVGGHLNDLVSTNVLQDHMAWLGKLLRFIYYLLPNLEHFNIRTAVVYELPLPPNYSAYSVLYGILYIVFMLSVAGIIFERKDL